MASAFRDTLFAYTLRSAFGSRVFPHPDEKVLPTVWQEKLTPQTSPRHSVDQSTLNDLPNADVSSIHSDTTAIGHAPRKIDAEKGSDSLLVEWYGPNDTDVSYCSVMFVYQLLTGIVIRSESAELVEWEEGMGHVSDLSFDVHHLRWICHLYGRDPIYLFRIPREQCRCHTGPYTVCRRLRSRLVKHRFNFFSLS